MNINVYIADISPLINNQALFEKLYLSMPKYRKDKIDSFRFHKDKCLSLGAGILLKNAVKELGFCGLDENISYTKHGKPVFAGSKNLHFSLSHSNLRVMCVLSESPIGCDVEFVDELHLGAADKILTPSEKAFFEKSQNKTDTFFRIWTLKESFMKLTGSGFSLSPKSFSLSFENGIFISQNQFDGKFDFFEFDLKDDYKYSVAVKDFSGDLPNPVFVSFENLPF